MSFQSFGLPDYLMQAIEQLGYTEPTAIQQQAVPILSAGQSDFVGLAQTGTGKTCAFSLPLLQQINTKERHCQAIILLPTRELCQQVTGEVMKLAQFMPEIKIEAVYGGSEMQKQSSALRKGVHVVVATPGRLLDQIRRGNASLDEVKYIVLDEADKMLEMGFEDDVREIIEQANDERKIWLFSATMPRQIRQIADQYMNQPAEVTVGFKNMTAENISHHFYVCKLSDRMEVLRRIIDFHPDIYGLVFTRTRSDAQMVAEELMKNGYNADALHGDLAQNQRERVMKMFRERTLQILVATDVAARGLDVQDVTHVIHYGVPDDIDTYIHRAGRTARAGKSGTSIAITAPGDGRRQEQIERLIKRKFDKQTIPSAQQVVEKRLENYLFKMAKAETETETVSRFLPLFETALGELEKEELIRVICAKEVSKYEEFFQNNRDLNIPVRPPRESVSSDRRGRTVERTDRRDSGRSSGSMPGKYVRFQINLGKKDGFEKREFLDWLSRQTRLPVSHIRGLDLQGSLSFFESFADEAHLVEQRLSQAIFHNRSVKCTIAQGTPREANRADYRERDFAYSGESSYGRSSGGGSGRNDRRTSSYDDSFSYRNRGGDGGGSGGGTKRPRKRS